ncbi:MAG: HEAT repeat domain-containing protein [Planctomycetota bacterium]
MLVFAALILSCVFSVTVQNPTPITDDLPELSKPLREILNQLTSTDIKVRQQAMQTVLQSPDPALLPYLKNDLNDPDPSNRRQLTMFILRAFPDHSFQHFKQWLSEDGIHRREASAHALGYIHDMRVLPLLKTAIEDPNEKIQIAALRALQSLARIDLPLAFKRVSSQQTTSTEQNPQIRAEAVSLLNLKGRSNPTNLNLQTARLRCIDSSSAKENRTSWVHSLSDHPSTQILYQNIFDTNQHWLGRYPVAKPLHYNFSMLNAVAGTSKEIAISANVEDIEALRSLDYDLDRVIHLRLASDLLFNIPAAVEPTIKATDDSIVVDFEIDGFPFRHAGIGLLNISYWESRIQQGHSAHLRFDRTTYRLLEETIKDATGNTLWVVTTPTWLEGPGNVPMQIDIDMPGGNVGAKLKHLKMALKFQNHLSGWLLHEAQTNEVTAEGNELRAYCEVTAISASTPKGNHKTVDE